LYPLKFKPIIKDKIWGGTRLKTLLNKDCQTIKAGESWEISGYPGSVSRVRNGLLTGNNLEELIEVYMADLVGESVFEKYGTMFPLLIKFIDANDMLSVQVHPGDDMAARHFDSYGKTEMWCILDAEKDSKIITGFNKQMSRELFLNHLYSKTLMDVLHVEQANPGDVFFIPPGRVHAIGSGVLLAEIQQTSDATLRIYDYDRVDEHGRPRDLHIDMALDAIDYNYYSEYKTKYSKKPNGSSKLGECRYFTVNCLEFNQVLEKNYYDIDSFIIYVCTSGSCYIDAEKCDRVSLKMGETVLIPACLHNVKLIPDKEAKILEAYIPGETVTAKSNKIIDNLL